MSERESLWHHVPQDSLRPESAIKADPPWPSYDVVHRMDYERVVAALKDILDAAERAHAGFPIESEEWYARRDYARIQVARSE